MRRWKNTTVKMYKHLTLETTEHVTNAITVVGFLKIVHKNDQRDFTLCAREPTA